MSGFAGTDLDLLAMEHGKKAGDSKTAAAAAADDDDLDDADGDEGDDDDDTGDSSHGRRFAVPPPAAAAAAAVGGGDAAARRPAAAATAARGRRAGDDDDGGEAHDTLDADASDDERDLLRAARQMQRSEHGVAGGAGSGGAAGADTLAARAAAVMSAPRRQSVLSDTDSDDGGSDGDEPDEAQAAAAAAAAAKRRALLRVDLNALTEQLDARGGYVQPSTPLMTPATPDAPAPASASAASSVAPGGKRTRDGDDGTGDGGDGTGRKPKRQRVGALMDSVLGASADSIQQLTKPKKSAAPKKIKTKTKKQKKHELPPHLEKVMGEANAAYMDGDFKTAQKLLFDIIGAAATAPQPYHILGVMYEQSGDIQRAVEAYLIAAHFEPKDMKHWRHIAVMAQAHQMNAEAIYAWTKVLQKDRTDMDARWQRALCYLDIGEYKRAIEGLQWVLQRRPFDVEVLQRLAEAYQGAKKPAQGIEVLEGYLRHCKQKYDARVKSGDLKATDTIEATVDLNLVNMLCELYNNANMHQNAVDVFTLLCTMRPAIAQHRIEPPTPHTPLIPFTPAPITAAGPKTDPPPTPAAPPPTPSAFAGEAPAAAAAPDAAAEFSGSGTAAGGAAAADKPAVPLSLDASHAAISALLPYLPLDLSIRYGVSLLHLGRRDLGETYLRPLASWDVAKFSDIFYDVGDAYLQADHPQRALDIFDQLTARGLYQNPAMWLRQARCLVTLARDTAMRDRAIGLYERVLHEQPNNAEARLALAQLFRRMGDATKAALYEAKTAALKRKDQAAAAAALLASGGASLDSAAAAAADGPGDTSGGAAAAARTRPRKPNKARTAFKRPTAPDDDTGDDQTNNPLHVPNAICSLAELRVFVQRAVNLFEARQYDQFLQLAKPTVEATLQSSKLAMRAAAKARAVTSDMQTPALGPTAAAGASSASGTAAADGSSDALAAAALARRRSGRPANVPTHPAKWLATHYLFLDLIIKMCLAYGHLGRHTDAADLLRAVDAWVDLRNRSTKLSDHISSAKVKELWFLAIRVFYNAGDYNNAYQFARSAVAACPDSFEFVHVFNRILTKLGFHTKTLRFVERMVGQHPNSVPLRILMGQMYLTRKNYSYALDHFLRVYQTPTPPARPDAPEFVPPKPFASLSAEATSADTVATAATAAAGAATAAPVAATDGKAGGSAAGPSVDATTVTLAPHANALHSSGTAATHAYQRSPQLNLYVAIAALHFALTKNTTDRHHAVVRAFAFFFRYYALRHGDAEAAYNVARAFHYIGALHLAIPYYHQALARSPAEHLTLSRDAAHNLAIIYKHSGAHELARRLYAEYCAV